MVSPNSLRISLFWFLLLQCCVISISIAAGSVLLVLSLVVLLALVLIGKQWHEYRTPLDYAFAAYIIVEFVTALTSVDTTDALKNSTRLLLIGIVYGVAVSFNSREKIQLSLKIITATVALFSIVEIILFSQSENTRLHVFQHYMTTGGLKMIIALLIVPSMLSSELGRRERVFYSISFGVILIALIFTNTRSAWLGFLSGLVALGMIHFRKLFFILIALILAFFLFAPERQIERAKSISDFSHPNNVGRVYMWTTGLRMWQDKPFLGFGDIDLYSSYSRYRTPTIAEPAGHLHNIYIHLLVTIGAIGFGAVLFLFYKVLQMEYGIYKRHKSDSLVRNVALGGLAVFSGFLVNGLFEWNFGDHEIMVFVWFTVGLSLAANSINKINNP